MANSRIGQLRAAPPDSYSAEDRAFFEWWYSHMQGDVMQGPLADVRHSTARYIWDAAQRGARAAVYKRRGILLFNPYSGRPRHPLDIESDPHGILLVDPERPFEGLRIEVRGPSTPGRG